MKLIRKHVGMLSLILAVLAALGLFAAPTLTGCAPQGATEANDGITGTTWSGTDSLQRPTIFTFDADGTVDVTYFDDSFADELDTWKLEGTTIAVTVYVSEDAGSAVYTGDVELGTSASEASPSMTLSASTTSSDDILKVTLTRD